MAIPIRPFTMQNKWFNFSPEKISKTDSVENDKKAESSGEVTRQGDTYISKINGRTVYSGGDYIKAVQSAVDNLTPGRTSKETVKIKTSGDTGDYSYDGDLKAVDVPSNTVLDFDGNTCNVNDKSGEDDIVPIRARYAKNVEVKNMNITGNPRYGMKIEGCDGVKLSNIDIDIPNAKTIGEGIRIEKRDNTWSKNIVLDDIVATNCKHHGVETYGVDGFDFGDIKTENTGGCGLLLNQSKNGKVKSVDAYKADPDGGYAGLRFANDCGPNITVDRVKARNCGRGVFGVSGSNGVTINHVDIAGSNSHGILLENSQNFIIKGGVIRDCGAEGVRIASRSDGEYPDSKNNTIQGLRISGCSYNGIRET